MLHMVRNFNAVGLAEPPPKANLRLPFVHLIIYTSSTFIFQVPLLSLISYRRAWNCWRQLF
jgi:hypothetical protein